jgi:hypothetical protein
LEIVRLPDVPAPKQPMSISERELS